MSEQELMNRIALLDQDITVLTILLGVTVGALDRPASAGSDRTTWTEALLRSIDGAKEGGYRARILDTLRRALEIGSEPTPPETDGGSRVVDLLRKAA
jgi:hypothetical protein